MTAILRDARRAWGRTEPVRASVPGRIVTWVVEAALFLGFVRVVFDPPTGAYFNGLVLGSMYGLIGVAIILVYRTHRIINFAAAALGAVPGIGMALLVALHGFNWWLAIPIVIVAGAAGGAFADVVIIRRFAHAPRLILTVATIGVSQLFAFISFYIGLWLGTKGKASVVVTPFTKHTFQIGLDHFSYDYLVGLGVVVVIVAALTVFLRYTRMGIAMRASAENADRAALLGIPVKLVQTASWVIAGTVAALLLFLRSAVVGVPQDGTLGNKILLFSLSAAVIAKMDNIPRCLVAGIGIGILGDGILLKQGSDSLTLAYLLIALLVVLLFQSAQLSRAEDTGASSWQAVKEFRPIPLELRRVREVVVARSTLVLVVLAVFLGAPFAFPSRVGFMEQIVLSAMVAVSLVVLIGWAGQISLGQFGIVGVGAAVAGKLAAEHNIDFFLAILLGALAGALAAVLVGLPALRIRGLYLAVTTMAFAGAMEEYVLKPGFSVSKAILPKTGAQIRIPNLWGRISLTNQFGLGNRSYYYVCLVFLALSLWMARAYRKNRAGRAVLAVRENSRAAASYSVNSAWTRLGAFAVSGAIAAIAGVLIAYQSRAIDATTYGIDRSIGIFVITVIGGLTSLPGAVFGAVLLESIRHFGGKGLSLFVTGAGLLGVLMVLPGGFAEGFFRLRDAFLRWVANRHDLLVPSLVADRRVVVEPSDEAAVIEQAEQHVEAVDTFDVIAEAAIWCPVCGLGLSLDEAAQHEHLQPGALADAVPAGSGRTRRSRR